ncbi:MAG: heavy-metal-associated domain-containing protein [Prevotellaceae bacterium]|jgi:copper chaperone CopZ|nr:heavy-metal-associated domain-containing protein [Prevotellaceae bacterium]
MKTRILTAVVAIAVSGVILFSANGDAVASPRQEKTTQVAYFNAVQMMCGGCASKIRNRLGLEYGVVEVVADNATKDVKVVYEPDKIKPEQIKESFKRFDFIANTINPDEKNIVSVVFEAPEITYGNVETAKKIAAIAGVTDVDQSFRTNTISIAYNHTVTSVEKLTAALKANGVKNPEINAVEKINPETK